MSLTPPQCRAARALLDWTQGELARRAAVSPGTVRGFECSRHVLHRATLAAIRQAIEAAGVVLLDPDAAGGEGVRRA
ncbi:helix-turn-helix transcriptional regulator [Roseomonas sp. CAU 1739]|uniref:helix-turn-helix domain-containing protein n=1 Tax=Roseomonas sp. CAU 1739 TaxID=3140364 RepID=UPI00325B95C8